MGRSSWTPLAATASENSKPHTCHRPTEAEVRAVLEIARLLHSDMLASGQSYVTLPTRIVGLMRDRGMLD